MDWNKKYEYISMSTQAGFISLFQLPLVTRHIIHQTQISSKRFPIIFDATKQIRLLKIAKGGIWVTWWSCVCSCVSYFRMFIVHVDETRRNAFIHLSLHMFIEGWQQCVRTRIVSYVVRTTCVSTALFASSWKVGAVKTRVVLVANRVSRCWKFFVSRISWK